MDTISLGILLFFVNRMFIPRKDRLPYVFNMSRIHKWLQRSFRATDVRFVRGASIVVAQQVYNIRACLLVNTCFKNKCIFFSQIPRLLICPKITETKLHAARYSNTNVSQRVFRLF